LFYEIFQSQREIAEIELTEAKELAMKDVKPEIQILKLDVLTVTNDQLSGLHPNGNAFIYSTPKLF
jgi:hypothetical protein